MKILKLQENLGQCHYDMEIFKNEIQKKDQKYDLLLEDFKKLGLENEKLKKKAKGKTSHPQKKRSNKIRRSKNSKKRLKP